MDRVDDTERRIRELTDKVRNAPAKHGIAKGGRKRRCSNRVPEHDCTLHVGHAGECQ